MDDFCITCGEVVVEGRQVCHRCMAEAKQIKPSDIEDLKRIHEMLDWVTPRILMVEAAKSCLLTVIKKMEEIK